MEFELDLMRRDLAEMKALLFNKSEVMTMLAGASRYPLLPFESVLQEMISDELTQALPEPKANSSTDDKCEDKL